MVTRKLNIDTYRYRYTQEKELKLNQPPFYTGVTHSNNTFQKKLQTYPDMFRFHPSILAVRMTWLAV